MVSDESIEVGIRAKEPKVLVLVDANSVAADARVMGRKVNFPGLVNVFSRFGSIIEARIYASLPPENSSGLVRFYDYLAHIGMKVVRKSATRLPSGRIIHDETNDQLVDDTMYKAGTLRPQVVVLCSGNRFYFQLLLRLHRYGIRTIIASTPQGISQELRTIASDFVDLTEFLSLGEPLTSRMLKPAVPQPLEAA